MRATICENRQMTYSMKVAAFALLLNTASAAHAMDSGKHAIHVGDPESKLINELGTPQRTISVEDST